MERRKALALTASILGGTIIGSEFFLLGCSGNANNRAMFSESDVAFLDEVGETILPRTERSPGAKAAKIGMFMKMIVTDCYDQKEQKTFISGIKELNTLAKERYSKGFMEMEKDQKQQLLVHLDKESKTLPEDGATHFFQMMKQLTIWGYFTSEPGATKALRYNPVPGKFVGCIPYVNGDKAWAGL
ncbi:MAG TPA: gluconate 2-dehydrogenase subunit 3 family protein [Arenibacter sp.]|nr:gluconate 2-dehydrogenase subunit 3 family protein [Arenibacter sp.]